MGKTMVAATFTRRPSARGFTAVELTMVAAIIAIIALLAVPLFRKRVEEARQKACLDELQSLSKAEALVYAETGYYFRLNDLDNTTLYTEDATSAALEVPVAIWNREISLEARTSERARLATSDARWNGPYCSFPRFAYLDQLVNNYDPYMFRFQGSQSPPGNPRKGAILILEENQPNSNYPGLDIVDIGVATDKYPLDPWGNPYFFFGGGDDPMGRLDPLRSDSDGPLSGGLFRNYPTAIIFSMGPDGFPGNAGDYESEPAASRSSKYWREGTIGGTSGLGDGDDLSYEF
jgi:prepilin-type N-terminal cleavage/methylation domain-containing protein